MSAFNWHFGDVSSLEEVWRIITVSHCYIIKKDNTALLISPWASWLTWGGDDARTHVCGCVGRALCVCLLVHVCFGFVYEPSPQWRRARVLCSELEMLDQLFPFEEKQWVCSISLNMLPRFPIQSLNASIFLRFLSVLCHPSTYSAVAPTSATQRAQYPCKLLNNNKYNLCQ